MDKIISALYLAKSNNREHMLCDLIKTALYNINQFASFESIVNHIQKTFHVTPIEYEITECIEMLVGKGDIAQQGNQYQLTESAHLQIYDLIQRSNRNSRGRQSSFIELLNSYNFSFSDEDADLLWNVFNEYLMSCFIEYGRKAINMFLPYKDEQFNGNDAILELAYSKIGKEDLIAIFKKIIIEYPKRLSDVELRYLMSLASRAERFYSLGMEKTAYEKLNTLQIKDLIVVVDTNILYSILDLHTHSENSAVLELVRLAKEKTIDFRLVYLPRTYSELKKVKNYLDGVILKEKFVPSQIRALLASERLDKFARKYYENKLINTEYPHPSERVAYAMAMLKDRGLEIYNAKFRELEDDEEKEYINSLIIEYKDFQQYYNNICDEQGNTHRLNKDIKKIEHDVYLRESIKILKNKNERVNDLNFICLTLDRSLIHFDHYSLSISNGKKAINPNFILPSIFIKKIRPFLPIVTSDYQKAFISALTAPSIEVEDNRESIAIQRSMSYFKNLGIESEEIILDCIRDELFLENLSEHEQDNSQDAFIRTEIGRRIERIEQEKKELEIQLVRNNERNREIEKVANEKGELAENQNKIIESLNKEIKLRNGEIESLKHDLEITKKEQSQILAQLKEIKTAQALQVAQEKWEREKEKYINCQFETQSLCNKKDIKYFLFILMLFLLPVATGVLIKAIKKIQNLLEVCGINEICIYIGLAIITTIEVFGRAYIFDKSRVKNGYRYLILTFNKKKAQCVLGSSKKRIRISI